MPEPSQPHAENAPTPETDRSDYRPVRLPDNGRTATLDWLAHQASRFPRLALGGPHTDHLGAQDASFARAFADESLRRWFTARWLVEQFAAKPLHLAQPPLRAALLGGAVQLAFLGGVADHAAIFETVDWVKARGRRNMGGAVNAILRRVAGALAPAEPGPWNGQRDALPMPDGTIRPLVGLELPDDPCEALSVATSCPTTLLRRWSARHASPLGVPAGEAAEDRSDEARWADTTMLALHGLVRAPTILNTAADPGTPREEPPLIPHDEPGHAVWNGAHGALHGFLQGRPRVWAQDAAASEPVRLVADLAPSLIVDACAGQGTKTRQLMHAFPDAQIIATDTDPARHATLSAVFEGERRVRVVEPSALAEAADGKADLVLLDVPCSNTGVLPRRLEARYRFGSGVLDRLRGVQRRILADATALLTPKGAVLYATCSLEREENEAQAAWACGRFGFQLSRERRTPPAGVPGSPASGYRDASYAALLAR